MKIYIFYILTLNVLFCSGCYEDEIIDSKPGEAIDPVTDLEYTIAEAQVNLRWEFPSYPDDIFQPGSVLVRITVGDQTEGTVILEEAPVSYTYTAYDPSKSYRFTVKLIGAVETSTPYVSNLRYALGKTVAF